MTPAIRTGCSAAGLCNGSKLIEEDKDFSSLLSDELMLLIFSRLDPQSLARCSNVGHRWHRLSRDDGLWKRLYRRRYGLWRRRLGVGQWDGRAGLKDPEDSDLTVRQPWKERFAIAFRWDHGICKLGCEHIAPFKGSRREVELWMVTEMMTQTCWTILGAGFWHSLATRLIIEMKKCPNALCIDKCPRPDSIRIGLAAGREVICFEGGLTDKGWLKERVRIYAQEEVKQIAMMDQLLVTYGVTGRLMMWLISDKEDRPVELVTMRSCISRSNVKLDIRYEKTFSDSSSVGLPRYTVSVCSVPTQGVSHAAMVNEFEVNVRSDLKQSTITSSRNLFAPIGSTPALHRPRKSLKRSYDDTIQTDDSRFQRLDRKICDMNYSFPWLALALSNNTVEIYRAPSDSPTLLFWQAFLPRPPDEYIDKRIAHHSDRDAGRSILKHHSTLYGHTGGVTSVAIKDDRCISAATDGTIKIWDLNYGLDGHPSPLTSNLPLIDDDDYDDDYNRDLGARGRPVTIPVKVPFAAAKHSSTVPSTHRQPICSHLKFDALRIHCIATFDSTPQTFSGAAAPHRSHPPQGGGIHNPPPSSHHLLTYSFI